MNIERIKNQILSIHWKSIHLPAINPDSQYFRLLAIVLAIILIVYIINFILSHTFLGQRYRIFVAPGVILHELSHAFFCVITGAKIKKIAMFDKEGGSVEHEQSKLPVLGQVLISFAPFAAGAVTIYFLARFTGFATIKFDWQHLSYDSVIHLAIASIKQMNYTKWQTWAIVYIVLSIAVTMTPSRKDFENVAFSIFVIVAIGLLIYTFTSWRLPSIALPASILALLSSVLVLLIFGFILSMILLIFGKIIKK